MKWLIALVIFAEMVVCAPLVATKFTAPDGYVPSYFGYLSQDHAVYENYISQAKEGRLTFQDRMTSEPQKIGVLNIFWLTVGNFARVLHLEPWQAILAFRILLAPLVILTLYFATSLILPKDDRKTRTQATWFLVFANGIGFLFTRLVIPGPADVLAPEAMVNTILTTSPHMMLSFILLILCYTLFFRWTESWEPKQLALSALSGAVLLQFHPYFAPIILITTLAWLLVKHEERSLIRIAEFLAFLTALAVPLAYFLYTVFDPFTSLRYATNITISPPLWSTFAAFSILGGVSIFAFKQNRKQPFVVFCALWAFIALLMMYSPLPTNRRFLQGAIVPLGLLAFLGLRELWQTRKVLATTLLILMTIGGAINILMISQLINISWVPRQLNNITSKIATLKPGIILGIPDDVAFVVGRTHHTAYVAHWSETIDIAKKVHLADAFLDFSIHPKILEAMQGMKPVAANESTLRSYGINYLLTPKPCPQGTREILKEEELRVCEVSSVAQ